MDNSNTRTHECQENSWRYERGFDTRANNKVGNDWSSMASVWSIRLCSGWAALSTSNHLMECWGLMPINRLNWCSGSDLMSVYFMLSWYRKTVFSLGQKTIKLLIVFLIYARGLLLIKLSSYVFSKTIKRSFCWMVRTNFINPAFGIRIGIDNFRIIV